ncbi:class I SAM-dependent methyltransferase [Actinophytocola algeriensis]|uniref:2-polyprenyl-3-methyl-5-hydroxy-6-metoxy-1, 4-benzoquinol methylase n=1 Tax=Actinophytocola algeriensis TaxID=1768010 RepID=A0A7W7QCT1_9PSEU|nr:class I SAM-dependent methyltransferase [Actinophytocola algeriensis]MBB4911063.1 2-polyprenyl-3-methyl-5-hydroxy-6-metoxy-1,4-benzoquinol methylase [Actinophytocola algeriensis]MBE1474056.1 2-polyprenyl-3-methyl-5-hydroxy-6-metoxy-1,4-benzoquinol methylase [Actinophytocola algeriensis]
MYLGERLGLYRALADGEAVTSGELAARVGADERYVREWLEHQAVNEMVEVDDPKADATARRYRLPAEHVPVLVDEDDLRYGTQTSIGLVRVARGMAALVDAYRDGTAPPSIPWGPEGRANPNRARFVNLLGSEWLPAVPDVDARLRADPPARVADLACGMGWSSIAMARAYPNIVVDGLDLDEDAIAAAQANAKQAGVADRVRFSATDAALLPAANRYDLVTIIEALHDMSHPVATLRTARDLLAEGGTVVVADTRTADEFTVPASPYERQDYGWSLVSCLPAAMGDAGTAATGTIMRPGTLRRYATEAGFSEVRVLPIDTDYWRFYQLVR